MGMADQDLGSFCHMLSINYRTTKEILSFIAKVFYGGPENLQAGTNFALAPNWKAMAFYEAQGTEVQEPDSTTYYNMAEMDEIVAQVEALCTSWPREWGEFKPEEIGVFTAYVGQVRKIRAGLRKKGLAKVNVGMLESLQGREFRAVFISTVRTRKLMEISQKESKVDFGYLSDLHLINTAMTRTQCFVGVVGDPVALCFVGECAGIWTAFLRECQNINSLHPKTLNLDLIQSQGVNMYPVEKMSPGLNEKSKQESNWNEEMSIEPDEIISQLAIHSQKMSEIKTKDHNSNDKENETALKIEYIHIKVENNHAVLSYLPTPAWPDVRRRKLLGADDWNNEYNSESESSDDEGNHTRSRKEYTHDELVQMLSSDNNQYKRCRLVIVSSSKMFAKVLDPSSTIRAIKIFSRKQCSRGFNNDIVVVKVLPPDEEDAFSTTPENDCPHGHVIGILKRSIDPRYRRFVCMADPDHHGVMMPLNRDIPKMLCLTTKDRVQSKRGKMVCVYTLTSDKELRFDKYESIDQAAKEQRLFIVRFLKWDPKFVLPLCIVTGTIPSGTTLESGLNLLNIEYFVPNAFNQRVNEETTKIVEDNDRKYRNREDRRKDLVFTIDPEESEDLDDALSIKWLDKDEENYEICIHIADVSHFVRMDSAIDKEARLRGTTYYPEGQDPVNMLPVELSTYMCSLHPENEKLTLSLILKVNNQFKIIERYPTRCVIESKTKLSYSDAEKILNDENPQVEPDLKKALNQLHKISQVWRVNRLGNAALYHGLDFQSAESPKAHLLVQEFMIKANQIVAEILLEHFPDRIPLRVQDSPDEVAIDEWREAHTGVAQNCLVLRQPYLPTGSVCRCRGRCICVPVVTDAESSNCVNIRKNRWQEIMSNLESDMATTVSTVVSPDILPDAEVALIKLQHLQEGAVYICSGDIDNNQHKHHSLLINHYTHFTSPIRRYIDIVVHRLLSAVVDDKPCPYKKEDISTLCEHCSHAVQRSSQYEKATKRLQLAAHLQEIPVNLYPAVESITANSIQIRSSNVTCAPAKLNKIAVSKLQPCGEPAMTENIINITWQGRIYDVSKMTEENLPQASYLQEVHILNPDKYTINMPENVWQQLLNAVVDGRTTEMTQACNIASSVSNSTDDSEYVDDVSSEVLGITRTNQNCRFQLTLKTGSVLKLQISAEMFKGLLTPCLQMLELTPSLHICLEHRIDPVECFVDLEPRSASRQTYKNIDHYKELWSTLVQLEAAYGSVTDGDTFIIHNVNVIWSKSHNEVCGMFELPIDFCKTRSISFNTFPVDDENDEDLLPEQTLDFLCIRYNNIHSNHNSYVCNELQQYGLDTTEAITWVGHCVSTSVVREKRNESVKVSIRLVRSKTPIPSELMGRGNEHKATLEIIPKSLSSRREEQALINITRKSNTTAQNIAFGRKLSELSAAHVAAVKPYKHLTIPNLSKANQPQQEAVDRALTHPYTLIQGPPGTGKTITGVRLATTFAFFNRSQPSTGDIRPQVMYCGPSNKSVDVVAGYLQRQGTAGPQIVRVYSELIEREEFPLPMDVLGHSRQKKAPYVKTDDMKALSLHIMIRESAECSKASEIRQIDNMIGECIELRMDLPKSEKQKLYTLIKEAKLEVMKKKEIILCTCHTSGGTFISEATNIKQLIIDECGMCTEPASMVPIVTTKPQQVILIGDHKQLRPVVRNETAKRLGLETSLFERHSKQAKMLTTQYRMHEAIAEFPSKQFYKGQLRTGTDQQHIDSTLNIWPNGRNKPIVFVHTIGCEETLTVSTDIGSEQSKSNQQEVDKAVRVAFHLVKNCKIPEKSILILSQYKAQIFKMTESLKNQRLTDVGVNTVISAQGSECDYVILSTVRSLPKSQIDRKASISWRRRHMGFINDDHQINVALTRAKKGFIIIGNKNLLECHPMWRSLIDHYQQQKKIIKAENFMAL